MPLTLKVFKLVSFEKVGPDTTIVTVYVVLATPLAAVTSTVNVLLPVTRPEAPFTITTALGSAASATTVTDVVPFATVTVPPSTTSLPLIAKTAKLESSF